MTAECAECGKDLGDDECIIIIGYTSYFKCKRCTGYTQVNAVSNRKFTYPTTESDIVKAILKPSQLFSC